MRKILLASHGNLAEGLAHTAEMITGLKGCIDYLCLYMDDEDPDQKISNYFSSVREYDQVFVFTDLIGGSVNQKMLPYTAQKNILLFSGMNLSMVLSAVTLDTQTAVSEDIENIVSDAKNGIQFMNHFQTVKTQWDEF